MLRDSVRSVFFVRSHPVEERGERSALAATLHFQDLIQHDPAKSGTPGGRLVHPEIDAVDISVRKPQAPVMGVVGGLSRNFLHREVAGDDNARSRPQGMQIGLGRLGPYEELGERLPVDVDRDPAGRLRQLHLGGERGDGQHNSEQPASHARH